MLMVSINNITGYDLTVQSSNIRRKKKVLHHAD